MTTPQDPIIPEEILASEQKRAAPLRDGGPSVLGLPGLPADLLDLAVKYGPILVLAAAAFTAYSLGVSLLLPQPASASAALIFVLNLAVAVTMGLSYVWLKQKRRAGWNMLAFALIIQFFGQVLITGVSSILFTGFQLLATAYIMLQVRGSFSK